MQMLKYKIVPVTPYEQNCTVLWCSQTLKAVVCDPGGDLPLINKVLASENLDLVNIILTHGHFDHAGQAGDFAIEKKVPILGPHLDDMFLIKILPEQYERYGFKGKPTLFTPDVLLTDGAKVKFGEVILEVIHCPGHTPGHIVYYNRESALAIVGDVIFENSIGRTDFPRGNHSDLINSIRKKLFPLGDNVTFIPGHGGISTFGDERKNNPYVGDFVCGE